MPGGKGGAVGLVGKFGMTTTCTSCTDCNNQACIDGTCGACTDSSQCCAPLECINGSCQVSQCPVFIATCGPGGACPDGFACDSGCCLLIIH